jgi:hypothetical protein
MTFSLRPPSSGWEPLPLTPDGLLAVWAWFKPPHAPTAVVFQLPPDLWQRPEAAPWLTLRGLAAAAGLEGLHGWTYGGQSFPFDATTAAYLDARLSPLLAGSDTTITLWSPAMPMMPMAMPMPMAQPVASGVAVSADTEVMFTQIEQFWQAILGIESDIRRVRTQLEQAASRLSSLNRDLSSEEALAADNQDKKDWQDARRWLRDCAHGLNRSIKEIDLGVISGAGQRHRFEDIIRRNVQPRVPFPGMPQWVVDFEMLHKTAKNVLASGQTVLAKGSADGERRANAVLQRIGQKLRQRRNKARGANA